MTCYKMKKLFNKMWPFQWNCFPDCNPAIHYEKWDKVGELKYERVLYLSV